MHRFWTSVIMLMTVLGFVGTALSISDRAGDFGVFYVAGQMWRNPYDATQARLLWQDIFPGIEHFPYVNPPFYALLMAPFSLLPFGIAKWVWRVLGLAAAGASVYLASRTLGLRHWLVPLFILLGSVSAGWTFISGQNSLMLLFFLSLGTYLLHSGLYIEAGLALSLLLVKPHVTMLVPVALVSLRNWRALKAWSAGAAVLYLVSSLTSGFAWPVEYLRMVSTSDSFSITNAGGAYTLTAVLTGLTAKGNPILLGLGMLGISAVVLSMMRSRDIATSIALSVTLSLLLTPYVMPYDMLLMAWPCLVLLARRPTYALPAIASLLVFIPQSRLSDSHAQPIVLVMLWLTTLLWRAGRPANIQG